MMTRRKAIAASLGIPAGAAFPLGAFAPGEFWNDKKADDWSDKDKQRLLGKSPWAKEVTVEFGGVGGGTRGSGRGSMGGMGGGGGRGGMGGGMGGGGGVGGGGGIGGGGAGGPGVGSPGVGGPDGSGIGGMGGPGGSQAPQFRALVRWESALPVREATKKELPAEAAGHYAVSVSGLPFMGGGRRGPGGEAPPDSPERRKQIEERLKESTQLQRKGKDAIFPAQLVMSSGGSLLFFFPRGERPIQLEDKEVIFVTQMGPLDVKVKFALKDMVYHGHLEL